MDTLSEKECSAFFILLRSGLWERGPENLSVFPLDINEWKRLFLMACRQSITGIMYRGICRLPDKFLPPETVLFKWVATADMIEHRNLAMNRTIEGLVRLFSKHGAVAVLQKGQGVASFYEKPLLRECGDIDFYFRSRKDSRRIIADLEKQGCRVKRMSDGSFYYRWNGVVVEHHHRLFDICNPFSARYLSKQVYKLGLGKVVLADASSDCEVAVPSPLLNLFLLNAHIMKHAVGWGIGLKQLCDMARACFCLYENVSSNELDKIIRRIGLVRWSRLLYSFLVEYLGCPAERIPSAGFSKCSARPLLDIVMAGGNMGQYGFNRSLSLDDGWKRKLRTSGSFFPNMSFTLKYAPKETFWYFVDLLTGQFKK